MPTITHLQMKELARNPSAYMRYQATGKLPPTVTPSSPLIDLLEAIPPRVRLRIRGVRIAPALGYQTARQFHTAEQLLKWCGIVIKLVTKWDSGPHLSALRKPE